jgi:hypothetical protein
LLPRHERAFLQMLSVDCVTAIFPVHPRDDFRSL